MTQDIDKLVARLRELDLRIGSPIALEAADALATLAKRLEEAEAVIRPFARIADAEDFAGTKDGNSIMVNVNLCRAARAALTGREG